jgi:hypothetical protein
VDVANDECFQSKDDVRTHCVGEKVKDFATTLNIEC